MSQDDAGYPDFQDHLAALEARDLLRRIDRPIDKDTELHPPSSDPPGSSHRRRAYAE